MSIVVVCVQLPSNADLLLIIDANRFVRYCLCPAQGGQKKIRQNSGSGDNHQQLDQSERSVFRRKPPLPNAYSMVKSTS